MDKIYSIVTLRMCVFFSLSKEDLVNSSNLQSILFKALRRVDRSSLNVGQWRGKCEADLISKPQLEIGFKQS